MRGRGDGSMLVEPDSLKCGRPGCNAGRFGLISPRNRQFRLGIEEMQAASLRGKANLVAAGDGGFRGHAGGGEAGAANPRLQQDLGAELFDDLDAGVEAESRSASAEREMLRP